MAPVENITMKMAADKSDGNGRMIFFNGSKPPADARITIMFANYAPDFTIRLWWSSAGDFPNVCAHVTTPVTGPSA
jgi:hypothetical protein